AKTIDRSFDGFKVCQHSTQPTFGDIKLTTLLSGFLDRFYSLLFCADKNQATTVSSNFSDEFSSFVRANNSFLKVDDMNSTPSRIHIRLHFGVPSLSLVSEMHAGVEHFLHGHLGHCNLLFWLATFQAGT